MIIKIDKLINIINRLKATAKNQPFEINEPPMILFTDSQVIAQGKSYMSIKLEHDLTDCLLPLDNVTQILSKFNPEMDINITRKEEDKFVKLLYKPSRREPTRIKLPIMESENPINVKPHLQPHDAIKIPSDLVKGLKLCQHTLPPNTLRPEFNCFKIETNNILVGGGIRLSAFKSRKKLCEITFAISDLDGLTILADNYNTYLIRKQSVEFWGDDIYIKVPKLDKTNGPQVDIKSMSKYDKIITVNRQSLIHDLETASVFATGSYDAEYAVMFDIGKRTYLINSRNETGEINSKGKLESSDIETTIKLNPLYLMQALKLLEGDSVGIGISDFNNSKKLVMKEKQFTYIMSSYIME